MQRVPTRQRQTMPADRQQGGRQQHNETTPALLLARRIREEQGVEQLKAFLAAMEPFVAPNELRSISSGFGINYDMLVNQHKTHNAAHGNANPHGIANFNGNANSHGNANFNGNNGNNFPMQTGMPNMGMPGMGPFRGNGGNQLQMMQMLMNMQGLMKGGKGDMSQIFKLMGGR